MSEQLDQELVNAAYQNLLDSIAEFNDRYGYLGANWEEDVLKYYEAGKSISFRIYFEDLIYSCSVYFEAEQWSPDTYLQEAAEQALAFGLADDRLDSPLPIYIEIG